MVAELRQLVQTSRLLQTTTALVHHLQRERGLSNLYLGSPDDAWLPALTQQRATTDRKQGIVFDQRVACPLHNWTIGLADGKAAAPDKGCTPTFQVQVLQGEIWLRANELAHHAVDLAQPVAGPRRCGPGVPAPANPAYPVEAE